MTDQDQTEYGAEHVIRVRLRERGPRHEGAREHGKGDMRDARVHHPGRHWGAAGAVGDGQHTRSVHAFGPQLSCLSNGQRPTGRSADRGAAAHGLGRGSSAATGVR